MEADTAEERREASRGAVGGAVLSGTSAGLSASGAIPGGGARRDIMSRLGLAEPPERGGETLSQSASDAGASLYICWPWSGFLLTMAGTPTSPPRLNVLETKLFRSVYFGEGPP
jgi:hypothetical protein